MSRSWFAASLVAIVGVGLAQSFVHLAVVLDGERINTLFDLDRSNGLPDLVSTVALAVAALGAAAIAAREHGARRHVAAGLAAALSVLTLADLLHDGAHPASVRGWAVILTVVCVGCLLALLALASAWRARATLLLAGVLLLCSFLVNGFDQYDQRFERERGDPVAEYEVVAKEGLELMGWSLVALALWDEALRRRRSPRAATAPASRAPAAPTRHVA